MSNHPPETSIVIRAFNEERWLPEVFAALDRQRYRDFEVLLVDSGSVDRTRDIAAANGARIVRLRSEDFTFGHSLNVGIREARGSLIAILSAHAIPADEHWLERLVAPLRQRRRRDGLRRPARPRDLEVLGGARLRAAVPARAAHQGATPTIRSPTTPTPRCGATSGSSIPSTRGCPASRTSSGRSTGWSRGRKVVYEPDACIIHVHTEIVAAGAPALSPRGHGGALGRHADPAAHSRRDLARDPLVRATICGWPPASGGSARWPARSCGSATRRLVGTVGGIVDSRGLTNPARRAEMFFQTGVSRPWSCAARIARGSRSGTIPSLKPGEVLVRVSYVGICGTDLEILEGSSATTDRAWPTTRSCPATNRRARSSRVGPARHRASTKATASSSSASRAAASVRSASATRRSAAATGGRSASSARTARMPRTW